MITNVTKQTDHHVGNVSKEQHQRSVEVDIYLSPRHIPTHACVGEVGINTYQTADCELGFSCQNGIKPSWRNRLQEKHLNDLMTINIEGPRLEDMTFQRTIISWKDKMETRHSRSSRRRSSHTSQMHRIVRLLHHLDITLKQDQW